MKYARVLTGPARVAAVVVCSFVIAACSNGTDISSTSPINDPGSTQNQAQDREGQTPPDDGPLTTNLSVDQSEVDRGGTVELSWSSTGATSCEASGGWSGAVARSGAQRVGPLDDTSTFTLSCTGADGAESVEMISVTVMGTFVVSWQPPQQNEDGTPLTDLAEVPVVLRHLDGRLLGLRDGRPSDCNLQHRQSAGG